MTREEIECIQPGQKIRVSFETEFGSLTNYGPPRIRYRRNGIPCSLRLEGLKVEVIEPEYIDGEMYIDAAGTYWRFIEGVDAEDHLWVTPGAGSSYDFDRPRRPLRRLVPEVAG